MICLITLQTEDISRQWRQRKGGNEREENEEQKNYEYYINVINNIDLLNIYAY